MKYFYVGLNLFLVIMISLFVFIKPEEKKITRNFSPKIVNTGVFTGVQLRTEKEFIFDNDFDEALFRLESGVFSNSTSAEVISDVLETKVGSLSAYGPDCKGCSGHLGGGYDASSGSYYYNDKKYGNIRIVAGDKSYPYGTIVRVRSAKLGTFNAIVLDRGGGIGFGKRYLFDLLCPSEAAAMQVGSLKNVTFEVLRYGY